jgi:hypothetical protein
MTGAAIFTFCLSAFVLWGVVVDRIRRLDDRSNRDDDHYDHHRALMREIRRHATNQQRGNTP